MKLTIFTPTYNRAYILNEAYESLCRQTCKDFEWLIIDDGSSDNTYDLVCSWMKCQNGFSIRYEKTANGGKMRALNRAFLNAKGELFVILDSDDYLADDAVETILYWERQVSNRKDHFAGVAGLKCHKDGRPLGRTFVGEYVDCSVADRDQYGIVGDKCEVFYTDLLRKHPFIEFPGENFQPEGTLWMEICYEERKVLRWFNKGIYFGDYLEDGYSANAIDFLSNNPKGLLHSCLKTIEIKKPSYLEKLHIWHDYYLIGRKNGYSLKVIKRDLNLTRFDCLVLVLGHFVSIAKMRKYGVPE